MGQRQQKLLEVVANTFTIKKHPKPTTPELLKSKYSDNISKTYFDLGGQLKEPPLKYGSWDISTSDFIIELDEERHFNRYRLIALQSPFYKSWNGFSPVDYKRYCTEKENVCLRTASWGKNWKNPSTEKQFSVSNLGGILDESGSSRWKQRAYYDFLKDTSSFITGIPLIRISIYDTYAGVEVGKLLVTNQDKLLLELVMKRLRSL